jgi:hypothetical protein
MFANKTKNKAIKFISCTVAYAISFFISKELHILTEASYAPHIIIVSATTFKVGE